MKELLPPAFYARDAAVVARELLGAYIVRDDVVLRITETEAYVGPEDTACHARSGPTSRTAPLFGPPGRAYLYLCYGIHWLLNAVTGPEGFGSGVLIRSAEPIAGLPTIRARRGGKSGPTLLTGPGKIGAALALDGSWSHHPLHESGGLEFRAGEPPDQVLVGRRVGIDYADPEHRDALWRFAVGGTRWVTHPRGLAVEATGSPRR